VPGRENLSFRAEWPANGMIDELHERIGEAHEDLFNDFSVSSRGHRSTLLYGEWKEIGIGMIEGTDSGGLVDSLYLVQNYAHRSDTGPFLTGVAYRDVDGDGFYTPDAGEALGGLQVVAYEAGDNDVAGATFTMASGGYSLDLGTGVYDVVVTGPGVNQTYPNVAILASGPDGRGENRKLDVIPLPEPGTALGLTLGLAFLATSRRARRSR
jgi:hypothetical protein